MDDQEQKSITGMQAADQCNALMQAELTKKKAGLPKAALRIKQALDAKETKVFSYEGGVIYSKPLDDYKTRFQAAKYITQIFNAEPAQRRELSGPGGGPIQTEDKGMQDRVTQYFEELKLRDGK